MGSEIRFAHLSDWHGTTLRGGGLALLRAKRLSGWASWRWSRRQRHSTRVLEAALRDVRDQRVDRVVVTGDLTHVSLEQEFRAAARQLASLGEPERVFLIPGNHDRYVPVAPERSWDHWADYLRGTSPSALPESLADCLADEPEAGRAPRHADYPTLRTFERVAFVGLCSAIATPVFRAGGQLGREQLERLEKLLLRLRERGLCRVVLIHHPVAISSEPTRRALWDAEGFREVVARAGAELVLHGHKHRRRVASIEGPRSEVPVIGVPSASEVGSRPEKRARYDVYRVSADASERGFRIEAEERGYDARRGEFVHEQTRPL
ncbi:MAG: metallophosphoesterase [Deltaproteobacteria bacterium]|jgi:3',5'-cyclic AMP phosphodiesterase CpdA|nr:metallophosphoesterase [Deltaproteobacteria bacterium]